MAPAWEDSGRLAARLVDKILRGRNPAEIPIERNPKVQLFLNAKTAAILWRSDFAEPPRAGR